MKDHRSTQSRVSKNVRFANFNPADALESLHTEVVEIEALAHAAAEAVTQLPHPSNAAERRVFARIYTLVSRVAAEVSTTVGHGDALIAALSAYREARQAQKLERPSANT